MKTTRFLNLELLKQRDLLLSLVDQFPSAEEIETNMASLRPAVERGYFTPEEDEAIRSMFVTYLRIRAALHGIIQDLGPLGLNKKCSEEFRLPCLLLAWVSACVLMRAAHYLQIHVWSQPLFRDKLNEAEPALGIPARTLTAIMRNGTRPKVVVRFFHAAHRIKAAQEAIHALGSDEIWAPIVRLLETEKTWLDLDPTNYTNRLLRYRLQRLLSRPARSVEWVTWQLFRASGSAIAEMRNPFHRKRVNRRVLHRVAELAQPGDVFVTRHDDAMSNLFLPGYWPHAALYIGTRRQRAELGLHLSIDQESTLKDSICILEAKKDGVLFRSLADTLRVDAFTLLRPCIANRTTLQRVLENAIQHAGKGYDFEFNFKRSDKLVCTELVYRSFSDIDGLDFPLSLRAGRYCFSAEDLLDLATQSDKFEVIALYGVSGNRFLSGTTARDRLIRTYRTRVSIP